ncbi:MAG: hypothetical protein AAFU61_18270, partial [Pseudomonadota bacterium]
GGGDGDGGSGQGAAQGEAALLHSLLPPGAVEDMLSARQAARRFARQASVKRGRETTAESPEPEPAWGQLQRARAQLEAVLSALDRNDLRMEDDRVSALAEALAGLLTALTCDQERRSSAPVPAEIFAAADALRSALRALDVSVFDE